MLDMLQARRLELLVRVRSRSEFKPAGVPGRLAFALEALRTSCTEADCIIHLCIVLL